MIMANEVTRPYVWNTSGSKYVDSLFGDDTNGEGTKEKPYKTLGRAWADGEPATIVCRGFFSEQMTTGKHTTSIKGDYYGAAIYDGKDENLIYGFSVGNMIILNAYTDSSLPVHSSMSGKSTAPRGVGRAIAVDQIGTGGFDYSVLGVGSSSVFIGNSGLYWGVIGGNTSVSKVVYWKPKRDDSVSKFKIGTLAKPGLAYSTVYDVGVENVCKWEGNVGSGEIRGTIFSKTAIILNDKLKKTYDACLFAGD